MKSNIYIFLLVLSLLGSTSFAPAPRPGGKDYALFIAVEQYDNSSAWNKLPGLIQECKDIRNDLVTRYGFSEESKVLENPGLSEIKSELSKWRAREYGKDDQLLIFFSGHGQFLDDVQEGYFIPRDGSASFEIDPERTWYSLLQLPRHINTIPCRHILLAIDACYSGTIDTEVALKTETEPWDTSTRAAEIQFNQYVHDLLANKSRILMTSGGKNRTKHPSDFVGYFRTALSSLGGKNRILLSSDFEKYWPISKDRPKSGHFEGHEPGGNFIFVYQSREKDSSLFKEHTNQSFFDPIASTMVEIEGGKFMMGSELFDDDEKPEHEVEITTFLLSRYEVTIGQYLLFCETTNSHWPVWLEKGSIYNIESGTDLRYKDFGMNRNNSQHAMTGVSWEDAVAFCKWLSEKTGKRYRLPTEAEWEYAARGGKKSKGFIYAGHNELGKIGWYWDNGNGRVHAVGQFKANELGLYDMSGNVHEWCSDWYASDYYQTSPSKNPQGPISGSSRVCRSGAFDVGENNCRSSHRYRTNPVYRLADIGFRVAQDK